ncbi:MAG: helix-turn-helix transcriptional regulator [Desulfobulbaceae bacterium]|nr:helix-turn-helix transcriptional regulator [Desulfobulbaceae bacterium]
MTTLLRTIRINRYQTLQEAADLFETNVGNLSRIEQGKQMPRLSLARRIAAEYELTLDEVYAGEDTRSNTAGPISTPQNQPDNTGKRRSFCARKYTPYSQPAQYGLHVDVAHEPAL